MKRTLLRYNFRIMFLQLTAESFNRKIACQEAKDELDQVEKEMKILSNKIEAQKIRLRKRVGELQKLTKENEQ